MRLIYSAITLLLCGCSTTANFYPVEGPLSSAGLAAPLQAHVGGIMWNRGPINMNINGASCSGEWSSAAGTTSTFSSGSLFSRYGAAYGNGVSLSSGGGQNPGFATMMCSDGNIVQVEFVTGGGTANGYGFGKDKNGNVFRVQF